MACNISNAFTDWDLHNFGVLNTDSNNSIMSSSSSSSMVMEDSSGFLSTGYLEDAVMEWSNYCKKQRLLSHSSDEYDDHQIFHTSNKNVTMDNGDTGAVCYPDFMCSTPDDNNLMPGNKTQFQDDKPWSPNYSSPGNDILSNSTKGQVKPMKTEQQLDRPESISSLSTSYMNSVTKDLEDKQSSSSRTNFNTIIVAERAGDGNRGKKVAYPFNVVKPGGIQGDVTLSDINNLLLMRPTRPIKHPVGDMACYPVCVATGVPGLSGKAVVAFTRIHTQGRGTVTIIRTKG